MVLIASALPAVLAGCAGSARPTTASTHAATSPSASPSAGPFRVAGTVSAPINVEKGDDPPTTGADCEAAEVFGDIEEGGRVVLTDSTGRTAGTGSLSAGVARASTKAPELGRCEFGFTIATVSPGSGTFELAVGDKARGAVPFTRKELEHGPTITVG
jgi:hypothetical protein